MRSSFLIALFFSTFTYACPPNQYPVKAHPRSGYIRYDGVIVSPTSVTSYCKDFSDSYVFLKDRFKDTLPTDWPYKKEISKPWSEDEKQRLIEALENVPVALLSKNLKAIYRMKKSESAPNPATGITTKGMLVLYDSAFTKSYRLDRVLAHELAHQNFEDLDLQSQQAYREAAGWYKDLSPDGKYDWVLPKTGFVAEDGKTSIEEDYANNIEYYLYEADKLKKVAPNVSKWIAQKFGEKFKQKKGKK